LCAGSEQEQLTLCGTQVNQKVTSLFLTVPVYAILILRYIHGLFDDYARKRLLVQLRFLHNTRAYWLMQRIGKLRDAQIDAVKTYLYLKIACGNRPLETPAAAALYEYVSDTENSAICILKTI